MDSPQHPPLDEQLVAHAVRLKRHEVFSERLVASAWVSPLGIGLIMWLISLLGDWTPALVWGALITAVELAIFWSGHHFKNAKDEAEKLRWTQIQIAISAVMGLVWGSSLLFVWEENQFLYYLTNLCILVGVSGNSMVVLAPMGRAILFYTLGLSVMPMIQILLVNNPIGLQIAVGWAVMVAVQLRYAGVLKHELVRQLDSAQRNVMLVGLLTEARNDLQRALVEVNRLVITDPLTGAYTRRYIFEQMDRQVAALERHGAVASLVMLDLDHFKTVNDTYGHPVGDRALQTVASVVTERMREGDLLARMGGEEFLLVLPMTDGAAALAFAQRLCETLSETSITEGANQITLPASFGVAQLRSDEAAPAWYRRVDEALYRAKQAGRNGVAAAD